MSGARLAVKVVVSLSFLRDLHPLHSHQLAWRTTILPPTGVDPIYWNTVRLGEVVRQRRRAGLPVEAELLAHISPLGWAHILLTGEYRWPKNR